MFLVNRTATYIFITYIPNFHKYLTSNKKQGKEVILKTNIHNENETGYTP